MSSISPSTPRFVVKVDGILSKTPRFVVQVDDDIDNAEINDEGGEDGAAANTSSASAATFEGDGWDDLIELGTRKEVNFVQSSSPANKA